MKKLTVGADPEVFTRNVNSGLFVSTHEKMPGTKKEPFETAHGSIQVDGLALEFNVKPSSTKKEFISNTVAIFQDLEQTLGQHYPGLTIDDASVAEFIPEYFKNLPRSVKVLGCEPDYNAYTMEPNPVPKIRASMRCAGGHLHVGFNDVGDAWSPDHMADCAAIVRQLDHSLYLMSLLFDDDQRRRQWYGQPGAFRPKVYGVEYRVLSNAWLKSEALVGWVFDTVIVAMDHFAKGTMLFKDEELRTFFQLACDPKYASDIETLEEMYWYLIGMDFPTLPAKYTEVFKKVA